MHFLLSAPRCFVPIETEQAGAAALGDIAAPRGRVPNSDTAFPALPSVARSPSPPLQRRESEEFLPKRAEGAGVELGQDLAGSGLRVAGPCPQELQQQPGCATRVTGTGSAAETASTQGFSGLGEHLGTGGQEASAARAFRRQQRGKGVLKESGKAEIAAQILEALGR